MYDVCSSRIGEINILPANPCSLPEIFYIVKNCHLMGHLVRILISSFIWLKSECLQLDSNFIANNLRKMGSRNVSISLIFFTYNWPPSWTPS